MENLIKFLEVLGKLVIIVFITVLSFFSTAIVAGILQGLFGINITFDMALIIILLITIVSSILIFREKEDYSIFIDMQEEQEEEYIQQSEKLKTNSIEEEYINHFGF